MKASDLISCIEDKDEIVNSLQDVNRDVRQTFEECCIFCLEPNIQYNPLYKLKIETVLDFLNDQLNIGHWSKVPLTLRRAYSAASYIKAIMVLLNSVVTEETLQESLKCLDMGLLMGAPLSRNDNLLTLCATLISQQLAPFGSIKTVLEKKRKSTGEYSKMVERLDGKIVQTLSCPSVETFNKAHFLPQIPVKLQGCTVDWPACNKWEDVNYLLTIAGNRTVPIELGSHYVDENWTQKLMNLKEFIQNHYLEHSNSIGYLAQHNLFDQIPELKDDICLPAYCALSRDDENSNDPDINAWLGPKGTVSPLHFDPKDNLLTQIYGVKQVLLYSPLDTQYLYPHDGQLLFNTAQVDPVNPDLTKYLMFPRAKMFKCLLEPGEMLYIPLKWWHHVTALSKSFSVSFWWH